MRINSNSKLIGWTASWRTSCLLLTVLALTACSKERIETPIVPSDYLSNLAANFEPGALVSPPTIVECTLSGGTRTQCVSLTVGIEPTGFTPGPWCPRNIADAAEKAGIWLDNGNVYDADGAFIAGLATFYKDQEWQMFDSATGAINVTDTLQSCQAAARPDVDPQYFNYCVECQPSYLDDDATMTYTIPVQPVRVSEPAKRVGFSGVGLAYSGVRLDASAPVDAILNAHTLAPFDDCGGHVNLHVGYHLHAVTNCLKEVTAANHEPSIGIAMDGFPVHARAIAGGDALDRCGGHDFGDLGYHYHAAEPGKNAILGCHVAETGCADSNKSVTCKATSRPRRP